MEIKHWDSSDGIWPQQGPPSLGRHEQVGRPGGTIGMSASTMPMDVYKQGNDIVVKVYLPGVHIDDLDVTIAADVLTIRVNFKDEEAGSPEYVLKERVTGTFSRTLTLPAPVQAESARAILGDGVPKLILPGSRPARKAHIKVRPARG